MVSLRLRLLSSITNRMAVVVTLIKLCRYLIYVAVACGCLI